MFESLSHGGVAFGFFNIDSDMLLLENMFFFASDFCDHVSAMAAGNAGGVLKGARVIEDPARIGDLHGAIRGTGLAGFIGDVYRRFPFPRDPELFRQKPEGSGTRAEIESMIAPYAYPRDIPFAAGPGLEVLIGPCLFDKRGFHELLRYVWRGGYPTWRDGTKPAYVTAMAEAVERSRDPLFKGMSWE